MVKLNTIGMIADNKKSDPTVVAHAEILNGYLHTVSEDGKTAAPAAGTSSTSQAADLKIALNTQVGDDQYADGYKITAGDKVNSFALKEWDGQNITVNETNITYETGQTYANITAYVNATTPATLFVAGTDGNFAIANETVAGYHKVYFKTKKKVNYAGNAVDLQICLN